MLFHGFIKTTLIDYPNTIASLVFTGGCNFHCPYCYNPELANAETIPNYTAAEIISHLNKHCGKIEGLCISGGEPLIYGKQLIDFIDEVKNLGMKVKLDTNGSQPHFLKKANVDYIAMDIKSSYEKYSLFIGNGQNLDETIAKISESTDYIMKSGIEYEFRTTVVPKLVTKSDIETIAENIIPNARKYYLNQFRPQITLDKEFGNIKPYSDAELQEMAEICNNRGIPCKVRSGYSTEGVQHKL